MNYNHKREDNTKLVNLHKGHRARLRKELITMNFDNVEEYKLLEYVLQMTNKQKDTNPIAHNLINEFGSFSAVLDASVDDLKKVKGVGEVSATFLHSLPSMFKLYKKSKLVEKPVISNARQIFEYFGTTFNHMPAEELHVILLDSNSKLIEHKQLSRGNNNQVAFSISSVSELALKLQANAVILIHNHPNGDTMPSVEDVEMTKQIYYSLVFNGIKLMDHIITCYDENSYFSFKNAGILDEFDKGVKNLM
ncbi:MAG: RadC family protein, partial [Clostridiales bacterium]|nr:RadC family protein [Candidatus Apopatousia equi]